MIVPGQTVGEGKNQEAEPESASAAEGTEPGSACSSSPLLRALVYCCAGLVFLLCYLPEFKPHRNPVW